MLELKIQCENSEEAHMYLNAPQYHNLISDLRVALRNAQKHGTEVDVIRVVETFFPDLGIAADHHQGAY
jgi:hypothetical protein